MRLVEHLLDTAKKRLATLSRDAGICDAAEILLNADTPLAVVCDDEGAAIGVISRQDVMKVLVDVQENAFGTRAEKMMNRALFSCRPHQPLDEVWKAMSSRALRCAPVLDDQGRPQGVLHARDLATALLADVTYQELLLRDYVMGVGYQ
jgi:CBS domain-containing protein